MSLNFSLENELELCGASISSTIQPLKASVSVLLSLSFVTRQDRQPAQKPHPISLRIDQGKVAQVFGSRFYAGCKCAALGEAKVQND